MVFEKIAVLNLHSKWTAIADCLSPSPEGSVPPSSAYQRGWESGRGVWGETEREGEMSSPSLWVLHPHTEVQF